MIGNSDATAETKNKLCVFSIMIPQSFNLGMMQIKNFPIKLVFFIHFVLMAWGLQADGNNDSSLFYNMIFFVTLFWGMYANESDEPIQLAFIINCLCIVLDMITLFNRYEGGRYYQQVSVAIFALVTFIFRPFTSFILYRILQQHNDTLGTTNVFEGSRSQGDIARPVIHSVPHTDGCQTGSFDFPVTGSTFRQTDDSMPPPYKSLE